MNATVDAHADAHAYTHIRTAHVYTHAHIHMSACTYIHAQMERAGVLLARE